jgi:hypothetical protein
MNVFVVRHIHHLELPIDVSHRDESGEVINLDDDENLKVVGICSSESQAGAGVARARLLKGFRYEPDRFIVSTYALDEDKWTDGFITV